MYIHYNIFHSYISKLREHEKFAYESFLITDYNFRKNIFLRDYHKILHTSKKMNMSKFSAY